MTIGRAEFGELVRPVDIYKPALRVDDLPRRIAPGVVPSLDSLQPEDARSDEIIIGRRPSGPKLACRLASLKNHPRWCPGTDLFRHPQDPRRGLLGILDTTAPRPGRANRKGIALLTVKMPEFLLVNRHQKAMFRGGETQRLKAFGKLLFKNQG